MHFACNTTHDCQWGPVDAEAYASILKPFVILAQRAQFLIRISLWIPLGPTFIYKGPTEFPKGLQ